VCSACGIPTHVLEPIQVAASPAKFAALRNADCRPYLFGAALAMMADNIEHVITYWVLWQKFHSPALAGFEVISHWVPFPAVLGVAAVDGDHHLGHKPGLSHTAPALSRGCRRQGRGRCVRTGSRAPAAAR
jgi:hypothetical protein